MQTIRDKYRELVGGETNMRRDLIAMFIYNQTLLLAPICPHIADHIWQTVLKYDKSVFCASWPSVPEPDTIVLKSVDYLLDTIHSFRLRLASHNAIATGSGKGGKDAGKKKGKETAAGPAGKATHGTIYVAEEYPKWQATILAHMHSFYSKGQVPDNKVLAADFAKNINLKRYHKKVMPFVQMIKERIEVIGYERGLQQTCEFVETTILHDNLAYIVDALELEGLRLCPAEQASIETIKEECCPGSPHITFHAEPSVVVELVNRQPGSGYFSAAIQILSGDSVHKVKERMVREKIIKDVSHVQLYAYKDHKSAERTIPTNVQTEVNQQIYLKDEYLFGLEVEDHTVYVLTLAEMDLNKIFLGSSLTYTIHE
jgi:leucyl-tRNA synthetase